MENKDIAIIALLVLVIYLYWQNNQKSLTTQAGESKKDIEISELKNQVNHYQKLYQAREAKDTEQQTLLNGQTLPQVLSEIKDWESRFNELEELNNQQVQESKDREKELQETNQLYLTKINGLETALFNLAKQKIKGKKEAEELLKELEANWQTDKENWTQEKKVLTTQHEQQLQDFEQNWQNQLKNNKEKQALVNDLQQDKANLNQQVQQNTQTITQQQQDYQRLHEQNQELIQQLQTKKNWGDNNIPELKQELFDQAQATLVELQETVNQAYFMKGKSDVKQKLEELNSFFEQDLEQLATKKEFLKRNPARVNQLITKIDKYLSQEK